MIYTTKLIPATTHKGVRIVVTNEQGRRTTYPRDYGPNHPENHKAVCDEEARRDGCEEPCRFFLRLPTGGFVWSTENHLDMIGG